MARPEQKHPRYDTNTKAKIRHFGGPDWTEVTLVNLSRGGACVVSPINFNPSAVVEIIVNSPNPDIRIHNFMARVVWSEDGRFGLQFMTRL